MSLKICSATAQPPLVNHAAPKTISPEKTAASNHSKAFSIFRSCVIVTAGLCIAASPILIALYASANRMKNSEKNIENMWKQFFAKIDASEEITSKGIKVNTTSLADLPSVPDQLGYSLLCTQSAQSLDFKNTTLLIDGHPLTPELKACMEFEKAQQPHYHQNINQLLSEGKCQEALVITDKIVYTMRYLPIIKIVAECSNNLDVQIKATNKLNYSSRNTVREVVLDQRLSNNDCQGAQAIVPSLRFHKKNPLIAKIAKQCTDPKVVKDVISEMNHEKKEEYLTEIIEDKLKHNDCTGAFTAAEKLMPFLGGRQPFQTRMFHMCQNPHIKQQIIDDFNTYHRVDCLSSCFPEKVEYKLNKESTYSYTISTINDKPITPEKTVCLNTCASKLTENHLSIS